MATHFEFTASQGVRKDANEPRRKQVHIIGEGVTLGGVVHEVNSQKLRPTHHGVCNLVNSPLLPVGRLSGARPIAQVLT